jgi:hypothetical protein
MNYHLQPSSRSEGSNLFRSWVVYEFNPKPRRISRRLDRNRLLGFALAIGVGAGFWTAAGVLISHLCR